MSDFGFSDENVVLDSATFAVTSISHDPISRLVLDIGIAEPDSAYGMLSVLLERILSCRENRQPCGS